MVTTIIGSWRNWQTRHVQTVQIGVRIPASRPSTQPSVAELAYAVGSTPTERIGRVFRAERLLVISPRSTLGEMLDDALRGARTPIKEPSTCGFESHRWDHPEGDIVEGKDSALSAREYGFESRCPRQDGLVVQWPQRSQRDRD